MPVFDMIESFMVKKLNFKPSRILRFIVRNVYVGKYTILKGISRAKNNFKWIWIFRVYVLLLKFL